jgi:sugar (pentulose or hexulose) kinase
VHVRHSSRFLAIDAGTTSMKAAIFDLEGNLLAVDRQEYRLETPAPAVVELDAELYWTACCRAVRAVVEASATPPAEIASLCISSQGETLIPVDSAGQPLRRAIVWLDNRAVDEARLIREEFGDEAMYRVSGQPEIVPTWPACKILWIRRNEPDIFRRTDKFLLLEDFLLHRLTGQFVTERALQVSSMLLDIVAKEWHRPILDFIDISCDRLGRLMDPGAVVGPLTGPGAAQAGLLPATVAVTGAMDQVIGALGSGNIAPGAITENTGGALAVVATLTRPHFDPLRRVPCHYHARPDTYCLMPWSQTAGMALKWFRDVFCGEESEAARRAGLDPYDLMTLEAARAPAGADGLIALPHLEGAACPEFNPAARGVFFGATLRHTRAHFVRALLESVAYMLKRDMDLLAELGVSAQGLLSTGGGARSNLWLRIKADVLQLPVATVACEETACLGAAILGAVAVGAYADLEQAVARMARLRGRIEPDPANAEVYHQGYARYAELYERLEPMFI